MGVQELTVIHLVIHYDKHVKQVVRYYTEVKVEGLASRIVKLIVAYDLVAR